MQEMGQKNGEIFYNSERGVVPRKMKRFSDSRKEERVLEEWGDCVTGSRCESDGKTISSARFSRKQDNNEPSDDVKCPGNLQPQPNPTFITC